MRVRDRSLTLTFFARVAEALILGTMMVGQATAFAPNYNKVGINIFPKVKIPSTQSFFTEYKNDSPKQVLNSLFLQILLT